ncbi:MAG TPA: DUF1801 domain-containing protein [Candidatus Saccharimonadales bacterium]|nr:DUF1801 domain-containing protein [Candidatus Saccharimonadales bacterium]
MTKDKRIDSYINSLPSWQQEICQQIRLLIHEAEPSIVETIKFTNRPYFTFRGNVCAILATKDHVNIFIYDPIAPDPEGLINQGQDNATARAIQIYENQPINSSAFVNLIKAVVANNQAGGWRNLRQ